jgi:hypothetical protein
MLAPDAPYLRGQVLGRSRIGVRLASLIGVLRTTLRVPAAPIRC